MKQPVRSALGRGLSSLISSPPVPVPVDGSSVESPPTTESRNLAAIFKTSFDAHGGAALAATTVVVPETKPNLETLVNFLPLEQIFNNPLQPRQEFKQEEINELSESIRTLGVLQPILVRPIQESAGGLSVERYEIVAGERRWRAAKLAELKQVPVIIKTLSDKEALEIAIVENVQRQNLNPVDEARAYERLGKEFSLSQEQIAERVGKDRASVANYLRLLKLAPEVLEMLKSDQVSMGHAKAILTIKEPSAQISLAKKVLNENLSVRALEQIVSRVVVLDAGKRATPTSPTKPADGTPYPASANLLEAIDRMRNALGTKVAIRHHKSGRGRIEIEYFSEQELDRVIEHICR